MSEGIIVVIVVLFVIIAILVVALIYRETRDESKISSDKAFKYLRDNCKYLVMFLHKPGFYDDDNDLSFAYKIKSALDQGVGYKRELESKISELDSLKNIQDKELRKWCIEQCKGHIPNSLKLAEDLFKYITTGKAENK